jgi:hypothetical protein
LQTYFDVCVLNRIKKASIATTIPALKKLRDLSNHCGERPEKNQNPTSRQAVNALAASA